MSQTHEFWALQPFDLDDLLLLQRVMERRSFTKAGRGVGLTQSAVTRKIAALEQRLGVALLERTTRSVKLTPAGRILLERTAPILRSVEQAFTALREHSAQAPTVLRVGVSRSLGMAYLPGFFFAFHRRAPEVQLRIQHLSGIEILAQIEAGELDAGLMCPPRQMPRGVKTAYQFDDEFLFIAPPDNSLKATKAGGFLHDLPLILLGGDTNTGRLVRRWLEKQGVHREPALELDSFDLILNLVALGLGASLVPRRVLSTYGNRRQVLRLPLDPPLTRSVAVITRVTRKQPEVLRQFLDAVLF